jgi:hypothetical protein
MPDVIANLFVDVHPSKAKLTLFVDSNCFLIASTVSVCSLRQILLRVLADGNTDSLRNAWYDRRSSRFDIAFHGICAEIKPNMRYRFQVSCEIQQFESPLLPVESVLSVNSESILENLNGQFNFPLRTYNRNSSTSLPFQYGQSCFIDR